MLRIAGIQFIGHADKAANVETAERLVRQTAARGAKIACLPELFNTMYFCVETRPEYFDWAEPVPGPTTERMGALARELGIVLITPVFEKAPDGRYFNCAAVLGPDGRMIGKYRKSSIPFMDAAQSSEPRGNEKFYFEPGDLGFPTFATPFGPIRRFSGSAGPPAYTTSAPDTRSPSATSSRCCVRVRAFRFVFAWIRAGSGRTTCRCSSATQPGCATSSGGRRRFRSLERWTTCSTSGAAF